MGQSCAVENAASVKVRSRPLHNLILILLNVHKNQVISGFYPYRAFINSPVEYNNLINLDALDREIIKHLQEDGRLSLRELGRRLNVPHTTIFTRVNKLVDKGVIKEFSAILHPHKLGFRLNFVVIDASSSDSKAIASALAECEEVMKVFRTKDGKVIVKAIARDSDPKCFEDLLSKLSKYNPTVYPVDDVVKYDHKLHDDFINILE